MFKEDIVRTIGKFLKDKNYNEVCIDKCCIYYIKRYSDELAFYIRCSDNRHHNGGVSVEMFFTAIQIPDDRLITFGVGVHIHILTIYFDITDEMMVAAGEKIVAIENNIGNVSNVILQEIKSPYFPNRRNQIFNEILLVYDAINEEASIREEFILLKSNVCKAIKRKKSTEIFQLCNDFVDNLSADYFIVRGIDLDINRIKNILAEQIRAQCMLDI